MLKFRKDQHSGTIVLDRPERRNALSRGLIAEIQQALSDLHQEQKVRAVILTGSGHTFCAGMDLHEMHSTASEDSPESQWHEDSVAYRELLLTMLRYPKPIIAAVNGPAIGGGAGLVLASDIVLASREAGGFGIPAPLRGLVAGMVAPLLVFRVGAGRAAELMLTGRKIGSQDAYRIGVFHELVEHDLTWARSQQVAEECAAGAAEALALTKRMLNETIGENLSTMLTMGAAVTATSKTTEAAREGITAFVEKRTPEWP